VNSYDGAPLSATQARNLKHRAEQLGLSHMFLKIDGTVFVEILGLSKWYRDAKKD